MSTVFVQTGQCGNQIGYQLLSDLFNQIHSRNGVDTDARSVERVERDTVIEEELDLYFHESETKPGKYFARCVCLDTEPKVINDIVAKAKQQPSISSTPTSAKSSSKSQGTHKKSGLGKSSTKGPVPTSSSRKWVFDKASTAYRHGGAGNNWAIGYEMCSGDYLELAIDCIRRELERSFKPVGSIVVVHGVAGGTGSGLGTKMTEEIADRFKDSSNISLMNIAITPYHFGEVVVQHYNALLCLSKIASAADGVLLFENEVAQELCKYMRRLDRPNLNDINEVISSNVMPLLLPKYTVGGGDDDGMRCSIADDLEHLCPHPGYKFLDVKMTPQTSESAITFTFDTWNTLISTITKMQIKGTASERGLGSVKVFDVGVGGSQYSSAVPAPPDRHMRPTTATAPTPPHSARAGGETQFSSVAGGAGVCKSLASVLTLFGDEAQSVAENIQYLRGCESYSAGLPAMPDSADSVRTFFLAPYSDHIYPSRYTSSDPELASYGPVRTCVSTHTRINGYQRSALLLSNGCSVLPLLNRISGKATQLFGHQAFLHCYLRNGLEEADFVDAFRNIGQVITNYNAL
jgi:hypothetical protein